MNSYKLFVVLVFFKSFEMFGQCWLQVAAGNYNQGFHNLGIQQDGTLWAWG